MNRKRVLSLLIVGVALGVVLVGATLYAGGKTKGKGQVRPKVAAGPMIAGTVCMPDSLYYHFDLQDGPSVPGEINFNVGVQLWVGPMAEARMGLTIEERSPFLRVEVYRPGDTNLQDATAPRSRCAPARFMKKSCRSGSRSAHTRSRTSWWCACSTPSPAELARRSTG